MRMFKQACMGLLVLVLCTESHAGYNPQVVSILGTKSGIDAATLATHSLYTVPTGKTALVSAVFVRTTASSGCGAAATVNFGANGASYDDWMSSANTMNTTANAYWYMNSMTSKPMYAAASVFSMKITTASTCASQTIAVDVMGYLY